MEKTSLKSKIGIGLVIVGFACPLFGLVVPFLGLSTTVSTALVTFFVVGGPEIFLLLGGVLAGKEGVMLVTNKVKSLLGLPEGKYPAGKTQYTIGVALLFTWFLLAIIPNYVMEFAPSSFIEEQMVWFSLGADLLLIVAIFGFGGHQMISKLAAVFKWQEWKLPPPKK